MVQFFVSIVAIITATIIVLLTAYVKRSWQYWKSKNVECFSTEFPYGNMKNVVLQKTTIGEEVGKLYLEFKKTNMPLGGYYFFFKPTLMMIDLDLIKTIMTKDFRHFTDHGFYVNEKADPLSAHLFNLQGQKWKNLRTKLTPTFTSGKMKMMFALLADCSNNLIKLMDKLVADRRPVEIKDVVARYTTDIIGSCAFGLECDSLKNPESEFRKYGAKFLEVGFIDAIKGFVSFAFPQFLHFFNIPITKKDVTDFFINIVQETVKYRETNNVQRKDFMHLLLQLKNYGKIDDEGLIETKNPELTLTMKELAAQAFVFFVAGFETSSTTLTFCFYELTQNLDVQEKLRHEINEVLKKHNSEITYDALSEMVYMEQCINETLRKYPPIPLLPRECTETYNVPDSNVVIEKGTTVQIPVFGIHRDPEIYPDPLKFDPERFSPENKAQRHPFSWLPFGEGPRLCIGLRFGMMQTKVALTILLKNYRFTMNSKTQTPLMLDPKSFVLGVNGGLWLNVEKIDN